MWIIFKVFIEYVTMLFLFYVLGVIGPKACGIPDQGSNLQCPALEGKVLTVGLPGKALL